MRRREQNGSHSRGKVRSASRLGGERKLVSGTSERTLASAVGNRRKKGGKE